MLGRIKDVIIESLGFRLISGEMTGLQICVLPMGCINTSHYVSRWILFRHTFRIMYRLFRTEKLFAI